MKNNICRIEENICNNASNIGLLFKINEAKFKSEKPIIPSRNQ